MGGNLPAVPDRVLALKTPPFPDKYADPFGTDKKLDDALAKAIDAGPGKSWRVAFAIVALNPDGKRPMAHFRGNEEHYGASMIKVAALYSAFELRKVVKAVAKELGAAATQKDLLPQIAKYLNPLIMAQAGTMSAFKAVKGEHGDLLKANGCPQYANVFDVLSASPDPGFTVKFSKAFENHMDQMIKVSDNNHAADTIHGSGYGYLNGALASAGLLDASSFTGIWLAGDYADPDYANKYPAFRIDSVNDKRVAQATSVIQFAKMYTLMADSKLVDPASSKEMLEYLRRAVTYKHEVWIDRTVDDKGKPQGGLDSSEFTVTHNKLGWGLLKTGEPVYSEASIMEHNDTGRRFVVVWENLLLDNTIWTPVAQVIRRTIRGYLGLTP